ncbi:hypothetical protein ACFFX0_32185 [Citricoccus parietis]|uniref:Uncharacterized protein n=1 Tax=Citricoccus parietis TaxID=592307 RepID=A0ABV5G9E0_9MICC
MGSRRAGRGGGRGGRTDGEIASGGAHGQETPQSGGTRADGPGPDAPGAQQPGGQRPPAHPGRRPRHGGPDRTRQCGGAHGDGLR